MSKTHSGGGVLINGKSPLDKESLIDLLYPKGMTYVFPSGFSPITQFGYGNWEEIADNVSLPLGTTSPVKGNIQIGSSNTTGPSTLYTTEAAGTLANIKMYNANGFENKASGVNYYGGLYINFNDASHAQTVSIWERKE